MRITAKIICLTFFFNRVNNILQRNESQGMVMAVEMNHDNGMEDR